MISCLEGQIMSTHKSMSSRALSIIEYMNRPINQMYMMIKL